MDIAIRARDTRSNWNFISKPLKEPHNDLANIHNPVLDE